MPSIWIESAKAIRQHTVRSLPESIDTDVLVIGGGMAGILCAYQLQQKGARVILVEAETIGSGTTGNTTAKITAQHGLIYKNMIKKHGTDKAIQYYQANSMALHAYHRLSQKVAFDYENKTAYIYSVSTSKHLEEEAAVYAQLGIPYHFQHNPPLPFKNVGALGMAGQAQMHPLKLLYRLAENLDIYEHTRIMDIDGKRAIHAKGAITAQHIILATHFPLVNIPGLYFMKLYQHRSYVLALQNGPQLAGMYLDEQSDGHSFRNYNGYLLLGGGDHRTGQQGGGYVALRKLAEDAYPYATQAYAWATQDCMSLDAMPYIGIHRKKSPHLYIASGFHKWGMSGSMAAAIILSDLILKGKSEYQTLFSPQRDMPCAQLFSNALHTMGGFIGFTKRCPHMGCALRWNAQEHTWDCPCHGSRFDESGQLLDTPAKRGI